MKDYLLATFKNVRFLNHSILVLFTGFVVIFPFISLFGSSHPEVFLEKGVLKISSIFAGEHP